MSSTNGKTEDPTNPEQGIVTNASVLLNLTQKAEELLTFAGDRMDDKFSLTDPASPELLAEVQEKMQGMITSTLKPMTRVEIILLIARFINRANEAKINVTERVKKELAQGKGKAA